MEELRGFITVFNHKYKVHSLIIIFVIWPFMLERGQKIMDLKNSLEIRAIAHEFSLLQVELTVIRKAWRGKMKRIGKKKNKNEKMKGREKSPGFIINRNTLLALTYISRLWFFGGQRQSRKKMGGTQERITL